MAIDGHLALNGARNECMYSYRRLFCIIVSFPVRSSFLSECLAVSSQLVHTAVDDENTTLLHLAANSSSPRALRLLLYHGADVNSQNDDGLTGLHVAAMWGREEAVALLLENGSDPSIRDEDDLVPLDHALNEGI